MSIVDDAPTAPVGPSIEDDSPPSQIDIGYPLRLKEPEISTEFTGNLTAGEFWALQNTWNFIKSRRHRYALELYIEFYTENHNHINRFRNKRTGKICAMIFSEHAKMIFEIFREVVENDLQNWSKSRNLINAMSKAHVAHGIRFEDLDLMADAFKEIILQKCNGIISPTILIALEKLAQELFENHRARENIDNDDVSMEFDEVV